MDPEQLYNFTKYRGQYLKETINAQLQSLQGASDDLLDKRMHSIESAATRRAKADVIRGRTD